MPLFLEDLAQNNRFQQRKDLVLDEQGWVEQTKTQEGEALPSIHTEKGTPGFWVSKPDGSAPGFFKPAFWWEAANEALISRLAPLVGMRVPPVSVGPLSSVTKSGAFALAWVYSPILEPNSGSLLDDPDPEKNFRPVVRALASRALPFHLWVGMLDGSPANTVVGTKIEERVKKRFKKGPKRTPYAYTIDYQILNLATGALKMPWYETRRKIWETDLFLLREAKRVIRAIQVLPNRQIIEAIEGVRGSFPMMERETRFLPSAPQIFATLRKRRKLLAALRLPKGFASVPPVDGSFCRPCVHMSPLRYRAYCL